MMNSGVSKKYAPATTEIHHSRPNSKHGDLFCLSQGILQLGGPNDKPKPIKNTKKF